MDYKIAFLLKPRILEYCKKNMMISSSKIQLDYYEYTDSEEFQRTSREICRTYDGIITSGYLPDTVLSHQDYAQEICRGYFYFDTENAYRLILKELLLHPEIRISEMGTDVLYGMKESLDDAILNNRLSFLADKMVKRYAAFDTYEEMEKLEMKMAEDYLEMFRNGKIKFALNSSVTVTEKLEKHGCLCQYILPSYNTMQQVVKDVCHKIDMVRMKDRLPAVIRVDMHFPGKEFVGYSVIRYVSELTKNLTEFVQIEVGKLTLRCESDNFEIYTDQSTLGRLTKNYTACCLSQYLDESLRQMVTVGYGVGFTLWDAHIHASTSSEYADGSEEKGCFLIDENEQLIHMGEDSVGIPGGELGISAEQLRELSLEVKLSSQTLIKIINILKVEGTQEISSLEIMNHLGVSLRTANHYLSNLNKAGRAVVVAQKRPNKKGRSINVYRLYLLEKEEGLS